MSSAATQLRAALRSRNPELLHETESMITRITPLLWHTLSTFPSGTSHTPEHTIAVEHIAGMLVLPQLVSQLEDHELQLLILACHFHDLGMAGSEADNLTAEARDQARHDHAVRIGERIRDHWQEFGCSSETFADALAEVCRGHRPQRTDGKAHWNEIREHAILHPGCIVRLRVLSSLIFAADELHIGADRAATREEDWLQIENEEARRHWKRHQSIRGPALIQGKLAFEAKTATIVQEDDLRRHVFQKAFSAIRDANSQLALSGFGGTLPSLIVQWLRDELWALLLLEVQSDHVARTNKDLIDAILERFESHLPSLHDLTSICSEQPVGRDDVLPSIERVVSDWHRRGYLANANPVSATLLQTTMPIARTYLDIVRKADDIDLLFAGRFAPTHEFDFVKTPFGKALATDSLTPVVESGFGVNLATEHQESSILEVMRSSPTVVRLLSDFRPAPSILVKRHLLRLFVLAGASLDLLRSPELLLRAPFRHAVRDLSQSVAHGHGAFMRLIEELALVGGFSYEQIHDAMLNSDIAQKAIQESVIVGESGDLGPETHIQLSQQIPPHLPPIIVSFPYLMFAGLRSGAPVELLNVKESPFHISIDERSIKPLADTAPSKITIGPGKPVVPGRVDLRARVTIDEEANTVTFYCRALHENDSQSFPVIVELAGKIMVTAGKGKSSFSFYDPALTASHLAALMKIEAMAARGSVEFRMIREQDGHLFGNQTVTAEQAKHFIPRPFDESLVEFLSARDAHMSLPWWLPKEDLNDLTVDDKRAEVLKRYESSQRAEKAAVTTITVRLATALGRDYQEEYLGLFPQVRFGPPSIQETEETSQDDFNRRWNEGLETLTMAACYAQDYHQLADDVRLWAADTTKPFPLDITSGPPPTPVLKSSVEMVISPPIDRFWFIERPVLLRFRPVKRLEQWQVEAMYWDSIGDVDRAAILKERVAECIASGAPEAV